ncbi:uncharacterized protein [Battus philenor]|uniref:uncharacterized protein n=1 Tax=Battus philenor TaxID=42288 RepID=UPI0035D0C584
MRVFDRCVIPVMTYTRDVVTYDGPHKKAQGHPESSVKSVKSAIKRKTKITDVTRKFARLNRQLGTLFLQPKDYRKILEWRPRSSRRGGTDDIVMVAGSHSMRAVQDRPSLGEEIFVLQYASTG